jgi:hypothetical protein
LEISFSICSNLLDQPFFFLLDQGASTRVVVMFRFGKFLVDFADAFPVGSPRLFIKDAYAPSGSRGCPDSLAQWISSQGRASNCAMSRNPRRSATCTT